jgi:hypothetical protein
MVGSEVDGQKGEKISGGASTVTSRPGFLLSQEGRAYYVPCVSGGIEPSIYSTRPVRTTAILPLCRLRKIFSFSLEEERESSQAARRADHITDLSPYLMLWFFKKVRPLILWQTCFAFLGYHRKQDSSAFKLALHGE